LEPLMVPNKIEVSSTATGARRGWEATAGRWTNPSRSAARARRHRQPSSSSPGWPGASPSTAAGLWPATGSNGPASGDEWVRTSGRVRSGGDDPAAGRLAPEVPEPPRRALHAVVSYATVHTTTIEPKPTITIDVD
jgi:hypothetical protein